MTDLTTAARITTPPAQVRIVMYRRRVFVGI
jgi:hypothetical protein